MGLLTGFSGLKQRVVTQCWSPVGIVVPSSWFAFTESHHNTSARWLFCHLPKAYQPLRLKMECNCWINSNRHRWFILNTKLLLTSLRFTVIRRDEFWPHSLQRRFPFYHIQRHVTVSCSTCGCTFSQPLKLYEECWVHWQSWEWLLPFIRSLTTRTGRVAIRLMVLELTAGFGVKQAVSSAWNQHRITSKHCSSWFVSYTYYHPNVNLQAPNFI